LTIAHENNDGHCLFRPSERVLPRRD